MPAAAHSRQDAGFPCVLDDELDVSHICAAGDRAGRARDHCVPDSASLSKFRIVFANQLALELLANRAAKFR
jgi:hypothetical protein